MAPIPAADAAHVEVLGRLSPQQVDQVNAVVAAATEADGVTPLSEHVLLHLRYGGDAPGRNLLLSVGDAGGSNVVGYAHLDVTDPVEGASAELVVHPAHRGRGHARQLLDSLLADSPHGRLRLWAHGNLPGAAGLAGSLGFTRTRELWQMRRSLLAPLPAPVLPAGVGVRAFVPGRDDDAWVALNAAAFADHPEQGSWTAADLRRRLEERWFDPAGFFLAERPDGADNRLVGFHWTKVHGGDGGGQGHGHEAIGEVYVLGVTPQEHGNGLGRALTLIGLRHLRLRGLPQAMLYVDADNRAAIGLYSALGFTHWDTDVMFSRGARPAEPATEPPTETRRQ